MIKIEKNNRPPVVRFVQAGHASFRKEKWRVAFKDLIKDYNADPKKFADGKYLFNADFGGAKFGLALRKCQGSKCCYCEKPIAGGQIEHFRPKAAWQQAAGSPRNQPGYYWLAYSWENMLISCGECNQNGQKGILFPVYGTVRALSHKDDYKIEQNVIINPAEEDPSNFITFNKDIPVGIDAQGRGDENIKIFKLKDRADIKEIRYDKFFKYETEKIIASMPGNNGRFSKKRIKQAKKFLLQAQDRKETFAGMIRENIKNGFL